MSVSAGQPGAIDGAIQHEPLTRKATESPHRSDISCIFVHAGAGYHSHANEQIHLEACNDAAQVAMLILRNGGSALDAVEMAVKMLEDREITNAGYGSNLAMDGVVECDASIVDYHGRSGAVGAVYQIKNPVSLARLVLNHTTQSLTLRRVPPNLLVAQGALQFAREMGMPELPHDALVSHAAKERWVRWHSDLKSAERKARKNRQHPSCWKIREPLTAEDEAEQERLRREHTKNLMQGYSALPGSNSPTTFEQTLCYAVDDDESINPTVPSDPSSDISMTSSASDPRIATPESINSDHLHEFMPARPASIEESSRSAFINSTQQVPTLSQFRDPNARHSPMGRIAEYGLMADVNRAGSHTRRSWGDGSGEEFESTSSAATSKPPKHLEVPVPHTSCDGVQVMHSSPHGRGTTLAEKAQNTTLTPTASIPLQCRTAREEDHITDTVGAIAIDGWGRIACAASSGGIGMKYRGRVGPAALVGVGTAVIPKDPDDPDETSVATVTSGTGEHMATTMAATVCAERLYQSVKKQKGGEYVKVTEDEALRSMIENEFMGHPSVKNSNSAGAIGILGVKKTRQGVMLYYGHNTDSFAMASMHSDEDAPWCTMSRNDGKGQIAQGGRLMRYQRQKKTKSTPTPRQPYV
ncbi:N-terminal nucleophile aminohydrolase [Bimuria novae-zelandiae CBS 107.79]|uniref:N-terminal nucleophile aminohydrolase n=1 Tax=Bimuria novae-zelandiae CBS 107.79 TaxID=1447943 RepID=A0A6A5VHT7_9PLEO|nr:N-terminal nucleophile aminohydrolase [Bimuria novae-zelandiae CBS 107.79]